MATDADDSVDDTDSEPETEDWTPPEDNPLEQSEDAEEAAPMTPSEGETDSNPAIAALLSASGLLFPITAGAGQIYNGEVGKGIAFSVIQIINVLLIFVVIGFITFPAVGLYAIYDAYKTAEEN